MLQVFLTGKKAASFKDSWIRSGLDRLGGPLHIRGYGPESLGVASATGPAHEQRAAQPRSTRGARPVPALLYEDARGKPDKYSGERFKEVKSFGFKKSDVLKRAGWHSAGSPTRAVKGFLRCRPSQTSGLALKILRQHPEVKCTAVKSSSLSVSQNVTAFHISGTVRWVRVEQEVFIKSRKPLCSEIIILKTDMPFSGVGTPTRARIPSFLNRFSFFNYS